MKNKARRIVSVICALAMCAAMVPAVFADSETVNTTSNAASSSVTDTSSSDTTKDSAADTTTGTASGSTSGPDTAPGTDTGTDTSADTSTDATTDTSTDSLKDTALDTNADTTADTTTDGTATEGSTAPGSSPLPGETTPSDTPDGTSNADAGTDTPDFPLNETGVTILKKGAADTVFHIGEDQVLMISGQDQADNEPIIFKNCTFNLSGGTVKFPETRMESSITMAKLSPNCSSAAMCSLITAGSSRRKAQPKTTSAGYDAAIYFFSGDIVLNGCELSAEGYNGQFLACTAATAALPLTTATSARSATKTAGAMQCMPVLY